MNKRFALPTFGLSLALLSACGGGDSANSGPPVQGLGTLRVSLTDAPACGYDKVFITVQRVRIHSSGSAGDTDAGWSEIVLPTPLRVDLLTLSNGALQALGQTQLPAGTYQQLRLVLEPNTAANPLANAVQPRGGVETALETPSALQSGLKMNTQLQVNSTQIADIAIDVDACKSVLRAGNSGRYQLKPVLAVLPLLSDAGLRIVGFVDAALANGAATVSAQSNGQIVRATPTDASGKFVLYPVPSGTYELVITAAGRVHAVMTGVPVSTTAFTTLGSEALRLSPPLTVASAAVSGGVTVAGAVANTGASVRAMQPLSGGPTVEVGYAAADSVSGAYSLTLPLSAPVRLAYSAGATSFPFAASPGDAGRYRIEASAPGQTPKTSDLTLGANGAVLPFNLP